MAFWSGQTVKRRIEQEGLVSPFDPKNIDCAAYTLHVGYEAFVTRDKSDQAKQIGRGGNAPGHIIVRDDGSLAIPPGQFAFLIAKEVVKVPSDAIGFISIKTRKKFQGLVNVSGFHVDPGWKGRLIFAVFNAGSVIITIRPDEPLFLLFFSSLDMESEEPYRYRGDSGYTRIPSSLMEAMSAPVPTIYKLNEDVKEAREKAGQAYDRALIALTVAGLVLAASIGLIIRVIFLPH